MRNKAIIILAASLLSNVTNAQTRMLGLEECLNLGTASSAELRVAALETEAAGARVKEARRQWLPSVSVQGSYARLSETDAGSITSSIDLPLPMGPQDVTVTFPSSLPDNTNLRISVQQPVFTGFRISSALRQAESLDQAGRYDLAKTISDLRYSIREAYWNLAKAKALEQAARQGVAQRESRLADAETLLAQGVATRNDALQARIGLEEARMELSSASSLRGVAKARLAQAVGLPWDADIDVVDLPPQASGSGLPPLKDQIVGALTMRPELKGAHSRAAAQETGVHAALSGLYPGVYLTGDYTYADPNSRVFPQRDEFTGTWTLGIIASLDIGKYPFVLAQADEARARLAQAREAERGLAEAVTLEVVAARASVEEAAARCASLAAETRELEENDRVVQERFRQGVAVASESVDARAAAARARFREQAALCDLAIARAALERATGQ